MPDRQMDDCLDFYLRPPGEDDGLYPFRVFRRGISIHILREEDDPSP